ncbi:MAG: ROK family protein [Planctomycetota bacterium]
MNERLAVGIDLGGTNLKAALVDREGRVVAEISCPTQAEQGPDHVIDRIVALAAELSDRAGVNHSEIVGAGIGSPGPMNLEKGTIIKAANLPGWKNVPLRDRLRDRLNCRVILENDANAAAYGEYWVGAGRDNPDFVLLTLGTGVGCGVVLNGEILHGHFDNAAELGHMIVVLNGLECPCGQRGCLEQYASASAVTRRVADAIRAASGSERSVASGLVPGATVGQVSDLPISSVGCVPDAPSFLPQTPAIDARIVAEHAARGDPLCCKVWDEACLYLAIACITIQHAYNPATVALGGGMSEAGDFLLEPVRRHLRAQRWNLHDDVPQVVLSKLGLDAGVIGAAGLAWHRRTDHP